MLQLSGKSIIGFSRGASDTGAFHGFNPSNGEELEPAYYSASGKEIDAAAQLAGRAFGIYGRTSGKNRGVFLRKVAGSIQGLGEMLVARASQETGLPPARIKTETARTCFQLRLF